MSFCGLAHCEEVKKERIIKEHYDDGSLKSETKYHDDGSLVSKYYFENGQLAIESYMKNGYQDIYQKEYSKRGILLKEFEQKNGEIIKNEFYCNEEMEQIFVRWVTGTEDLLVKNFKIPGDKEINLTQEEMLLLKESGMTGVLEIRGSSGISRECNPSRVVFIMHKLIDSPVELNLPDNNTIIYVQKDDGWQKLPNKALTLDRTIKFEVDKTNPGLILDMSENESGARQGGSIFLGI